jgi:Transposase DDE domain
VHLTETCDQDPGCPHLITQVETTVATLQDTEVLALIHEHLRAHDLAPAEHYVDQGYPSGPELVRQAKLGTQIIGPVGQQTSWQAGRTLTLTPPEVHAALLQRRALQRTPAFVQQYALRAGVEGTISQAVRTTRLRRTPYRGLRKTHLQHVAIAAGLNLKRIAVHLHAQSLGKPSRPVRSKSPFARLQNQEEVA